jgi:hypothetical protein
MLAVLANSEDECVVREFFELFKTPWEFYRSDRHYDVVLCAGDNPKIEPASAKLLLIYAADRTAFDAAERIEIHSKIRGGRIPFGKTKIPIYGNALTFSQTDARASEVTPFIHHGDSRQAKRYVRVGYDLFFEIRKLLVEGQPPDNAAVPSLDLHIALLRQLITGCGFPVVEIPPVPGEHPFTVCLTHDLDHASLRRHRFDATMFGFLYRATLGSTGQALRGRLSPGKLVANWKAAATLPLVHMGLAEDLWYGFDRYLDLEQGRPSTFFIIPFAGKPGRSAKGDAPAARGTAYDISHIAPKVQRLKEAGCEIGLHGIDAWIESGSGDEEATRISEVSGYRPQGVRMHWLYGDKNTPAVLEEAMFSYDSTVGYNETVGYRAGTTQVFKPLSAVSLLELPLHVMDTALFFSNYLNLTDGEAWERVSRVVENGERFGGVLTINWHDRSIAPERLWGDFYVRMVAELSQRGALFSTASQAVSWFRNRRAAVFERVGVDGKTAVKVASGEGESSTSMRLRTYQPRHELNFAAETESYKEASLSDRMEFQFS